MALQEPERPAISRDRLHAIRLWCRRRAERKIILAQAMQPYWLDRVPHEETRYQLGLTVNEYRSARHWLRSASDRARATRGHTIDEALWAIADEHVDLVLRFGLLHEQRETHEKIRERLGLSERDLDIVRDWWHDALAAVDGHDD